jgi:tetratricopeptide (TPR) repeat protein
VDVSRARLLADSGQLDAALTMFGKAIARSPRDGEAFIGRARVLVKLGRRKPAITDYRHGLGLLEKPAPECYLECAQQQAAEGQQAAALRCLDLGVERLGPLVKLQSYAFELELARQHLDSALARLDTIIANASRPETWLAKRGDLLLALGKPALARQSFRAALQAINKLPLLLQRAPHTEKLKATATAALAEIRDAPAVLTATP